MLNMNIPVEDSFFTIESVTEATGHVFHKDWVFAIENGEGLLIKSLNKTLCFSWKCFSQKFDKFFDRDSIIEFIKNLSLLLGVRNLRQK